MSKYFEQQYALKTRKNNCFNRNTSQILDKQTWSSDTGWSWGFCKTCTLHIEARTMVWQCHLGKDFYVVIFFTTTNAAGFSPNSIYLIKYTRNYMLHAELHPDIHLFFPVSTLWYFLFLIIQEVTRNTTPVKKIMLIFIQLSHTFRG